LPIDGLADFIKLTGNLIFGENSPAIKQGRVATMQVSVYFLFFQGIF
jgi:aspartate/tyrosine/aromatic aminotransferase